MKPGETKRFDCNNCMVEFEVTVEPKYKERAVAPAGPETAVDYCPCCGSASIVCQDDDPEADEPVPKKAGFDTEADHEAVRSTVNPDPDEDDDKIEDDDEDEDSLGPDEEELLTSKEKEEAEKVRQAVDRGFDDVRAPAKRSTVKKPAGKIKLGDSRKPGGAPKKGKKR